jgi:O-acetyl-ADP-ribose deacetylase (regulator of RNase III)
MPIKYTKGDATQPQGDGIKLVIHIVNDIGRFGSGFARAVMNRYPIVRESYIEKFSGNELYQDLIGPLVLGDVQFVRAREDIWFANMVAQHGTISKENKTPIKYDALRECLGKVYHYTLINKVSLHGPRFGSGLAGGSWAEIEKIINEELLDRDVGITIYDL